jgi:TrkA domain protein
METTHSTVAGTGVLHDCLTRGGQQFRILDSRSGRREIFVYDPADPNRTVATIVLQEDEADLVSELLHSRPISDRIAELERRVAQLAAGGRW